MVCYKTTTLVSHAAAKRDDETPRATFRGHVWPLSAGQWRFSPLYGEHD